MVNFQDNSFKGKDLFSPNPSKQFNTFCTFHVSLYLGSGGLLWKIPFKSLVTRDAVPHYDPLLSHAPMRLLSGMS